VTETAAVCYEVNARLSRFQVKAFATGMLSAFGHNPTIAIRDFTGEARFQPDSLEEASLRLKFPAASLAVSNDIGEKDRLEMERAMQEQVLEFHRYPEILFESSAVKVSPTGPGPGQYRVAIDGNLTLRGVTRSQQIGAFVSVNADTFRANGEFTIKQTDYGIKPVSVAGGTLKLKDELKFTFDIAANRKRE
jgi:polyisoprenoid-binding protein YceI